MMYTYLMQDENPVRQPIETGHLVGPVKKGSPVCMVCIVSGIRAAGWAVVAMDCRGLAC
jgi:hypothetical protein